jgi:hypothetical protein
MPEPKHSAPAGIRLSRVSGRSRIISEDSSRLRELTLGLCRDYQPRGPVQGRSLHHPLTRYSAHTTTPIHTPTV